MAAINVNEDAHPIKARDFESAIVINKTPAIIIDSATGRTFYRTLNWISLKTFRASARTSLTSSNDNRYLQQSESQASILFRKYLRRTNSLRTNKGSIADEFYSAEIMFM